MKFAYYPGCSAKSTAVEYNESVKTTARYLGVDLEEIPDWNCCGASSGHVTNDELAMALPGRNLALAEKMCLDLVTICPACLHRHKIAQKEFKRNPRLKAKIEKDIGMPLQLSQKTKHILEILYNDVGIDSIQQKLKKSLKGLKAVVYYGCYLVRPPEVIDFDDSENPLIIEKIMESLDIQVIDWSCKTDCCGAGLSLTNPEMIKTLVNKIVFSASEEGADVIITACQLCQANLDMLQLKQRNSHPIPIFFFSELIAFSLGSLEIRRWLGKHMVNPSGLLKKLNLL
jgi:heterodisulfide reductase subunit B